MFSIILDQAASYVPGETISGSAKWSELDKKTKTVEIRLIWYTEGKGDADVDVVDMLPVEQPDPAGETQFSFTAPTRPFSFSSKLISLIWAVEVVEFPSGEGEKITLTISPTRNEVVLDKTFQDDDIKKFFRFTHRA